MFATDDSAGRRSGRDRRQNSERRHGSERRNYDYRRLAKGLKLEAFRQLDRNVLWSPSGSVRNVEQLQAALSTEIEKYVFRSKTGGFDRPPRVVLHIAMSEVSREGAIDGEIMLDRIERIARKISDQYDFSHAIDRRHHDQRVAA